MQEINWGIIGCGDVTELKSGPAFNKVEHSRLVAVMRRDAVKAADYARRHGVPKWYSDGDLLINDPDVNAVYIATPPNTHASYAIAAMRAGKPVYVEKPMARTYQECQEMIRVSKETNMPLFIAYYRRTLPGFLKVKELLDKGAIGKPLTVNIRLHKAYGEMDQDPSAQHWHVDPEISGGGHFYDLASHQFDYLDFLFGPVTEVVGIAQNLAGLYRAEDTVSELRQIVILSRLGGVIPVGLQVAAIGHEGNEINELFGTVEPVRPVKTPDKLPFMHGLPWPVVPMMVSERDDMGRKPRPQIIANHRLTAREGVERDIILFKLVAQMENMKGNARVLESVKERDEFCDEGSLNNKP